MSTPDKNTLELVLKQWVADLKSKDRRKDNVKNNFDELFEKLKNAGATFDEAHELLPKAIKAHQPAPGLARTVYKKLKPHLDKTEKEYIEEWNKNIEDLGTQAFFEYFPIQNLDEDSEPKVFGNMSAKEYKAQRRYAEQFPVLNTTELEKRMRERQYNMDIEDMIKHVLGDDNG
jgi:hypothetical protein